MFKQKIIERHTKNIDEAKLKTAYENMRAYQAKAQEIKNLKEEQYQDGFLRDVFVDCLGYTMQPDIDYNLSRERKNEIDSKKADGAITIDSDVIALIELKEQNAKIRSVKRIHNEMAELQCGIDGMGTEIDKAVSALYGVSL